ncbi:MAG TPA: CBS domain-containing protein [Symbiobacteriaceae bacterium]|nr:CBS domain-containing protein [Symbiobacteriaceae bacterium]
MTEPRNKLTARDLMTPDVITVAAGSSLAGAIAIMDRHGFSQVPVMRDGRPAGLLTETDVRRALTGGRGDLPALELASPLPEMAAPDSRLSAVLQLLQKQEAVLVARADGALAGIITYWDLLVLTRPSLLVKEVELLLRRVVAVTYAEKYGPDWWPNVPPDLRKNAEDEHRADGDDDASPEHMLGHTSLWALIQIFRGARPDLGEESFQRLHRIRQFRNKVAHLYVLTPEEEAEIRDLCPKMGDWLVSQLPPGMGLD